MTDREIIKKAFENAVPSEELVNGVLTLKTEVRTPQKRKISVKRVIAAAAVACALAAVGLTTAAVIDFKAVFGDYISVKDSELANSLAGVVSNFRYKVSDSGYKISIKGVTGTERNIIAVAEISRADGEPVTKHFANSTEEKYLSNLWDEYNVNVFGSGVGGSYGFYVNDVGNIEMYIDLESSKKLNGKTFEFKGENFYPQQAYWNFKDENNIGYMRWMDFSGYVETDGEGRYDSDNFIPAEVDDSSVIALALKWEFSFKYTASENAAKIKSCYAPEEGFVYYQEARKLVPMEDGSYTTDESTCTVIENYANNIGIEIGAMGGNIKFEYLMNEYEKIYYDGDPMAYSITKSRKNEIFLITADGSEIPAEIGGLSGSTADGIVKCECELIYRSDGNMKEIADIYNVTAVSVNGTVYPLN